MAERVFDRARAISVIEAIDDGGGQTTDCPRVVKKLFALPLETREWLAEQLVSTPFVAAQWDWPEYYG